MSRSRNGGEMVSHNLRRKRVNPVTEERGQFAVEEIITGQYARLRVHTHWDVFLRWRK